MSGSIRVEDVGKQFNRYRSKALRTLKGLMLNGIHGRADVERFWALRGVGFEVRGGTMLGVIGRNGSGKSTLLRLLGGVMKPDEGTIRKAGPTTGLLELNSGMHTELTGRENVVIGGVVSGLSVGEVRAKFDEIVAFAELEDSIDNPVRTYSAGMRLRLGFAVAVHAPPGILLIDEVLAVGDLAFQTKCLERIRHFRDQGAAIVLASHDLTQITALCDQALWLSQGSQIAIGDPRVVAGEYRNDAAGRMRRSTTDLTAHRRTADGTLLESGVNRFGSYQAEILTAELMTGNEPVHWGIAPGTRLRLRVNYRVKTTISPPIMLVSIGTRERENLLSVNSAADNIELRGTAGDHELLLDIDRLDIAPGSYFVSVGLYSGDWEHPLDFHWQAYPLVIAGDPTGESIVWPPRSWTPG